MIQENIKVGAVASIEVGQVKKSVGAIHVIANHSFLERKIFNFLLDHAYPELRTRNYHRISVLELARGIGTNTNNLAAIKDAILGLMSKPVQWNVLNDGEAEWEATTGLASAKVSRGICTYEYSSMLVERLADPEVYSMIDLRMQQLFTSRFALNVYENCLRFSAVGSTGWWEIDFFRKLSGGTAELYQSFKYLRRDVIDVSVREINAVSDIEIEPEYKKVGRYVSDIRFKIRPNRRGQLLTAEPSEQMRRSAIYLSLTSMGMSDKAALAAIKAHDEQYLADKIVLTTKLMKESKVKDAAAFLAAAIRDDYSGAVGSEVDNSLIEKLEARRASAAAQERAVEERIAHEKAERRHLIDVIATALADLGDEERQAREDSFIQALTSPQRSLYEVQGYAVLPLAKLQEFVSDLKLQS